MQFLKKAYPVLVFLLTGLQAGAQNRVSFIIDRLPAEHKATDTVFLAGAFNQWNPHDLRYALLPGNSNGITLELPKGSIEYKFTRGGWSRVETDQQGHNIQNRVMDIERDTTIHVEIKNWADHFASAEKPSTANRHVHILESNFYIPQLDRHRRIWIYVPASYDLSKKKYPVLYLQDGQNVFDEATSFSGEWGVDEALDTLGPQTKESIVVAIDNGGDKRLNEYCPYDMPEHGNGEGNLYLDFLVKTLKPYIDKKFRTQKDKEHTFIAGSSMGGLISFYALLKYPKIFGGAGVFSPAFWIAPALKDDVVKYGRKVHSRIYFYAGKQESESMVPDMLTIFEKMNALSHSKMEVVLRTDGKHSETDWRREFPLFYKWLMR